jgi:probable rRNA maturation factor
MAEGGPSRSGAKPVAAKPQLDIEVVRQAEAWTRAKIGDELLTRAAEAVFASAHGQTGPCEAAILLTNDAEMQALNREWRGKDAPTNVLSFASGGADGRLGDIVLAYETVEGEAKEQDIAIADHAVHLVVHGILHLLGYDHEQEDEAAKMEALETEILATLGIADPYGTSGPLGLRKVSP